jgi:hypothetical protein
MNRKAKSTTLVAVLAALAILSAAFAAGAGAAPAWKFDGEALEGSETILGGAEDSYLTVPGLTTDCENFLYEVEIENEGGTGQGSVTEVPLFDCATDSEACTVDSIEAQKLPWAAHLSTVSSSHYIVIEGIKVAILYGGEECVLGGTLLNVTGSAGGITDNEAETATFNPTTFSATETSLKSFGQKVNWYGVFPTEAFQWHREDALSIQ